MSHVQIPFTPLVERAMADYITDMVLEAEKMRKRIGEPDISEGARKHHVEELSKLCRELGRLEEMLDCARRSKASSSASVQL